MRSIADRRPDRRHRYRWLAAAAAGLVVALGVGDLVLYQQRGEVRQELASQRAAADQARKAADARSTVIRMMARPDVKVATLTNSAGQGQGMVMIEPNGAVHLVSDGLSRNKPTVTTYVLWRVVNGSPKAVSTFDVAGPAIALHDPWQLPRDDSFASSFAVSLEPGRQMPAKPTDVVASGSVRG